MTIGAFLILLGLVAMRRARTPDVGNIGAGIGAVGLAILIVSALVETIW